MSKNKRINVILSENISKELRERMLKDGYGLREKSQWVKEAIESFIELNEFHEMVELANLVSDLSKVETIYIPLALAERLDQAIFQVRKEFPVLEGVKSLIVRASIIRRLVRLTTPKNPVTGIIHK